MCCMGNNTETTMSEKYRGYDLEQDTYCWTFSHDGYDGAPDTNDYRHGTAPTRQEAYEAIDELILEYPDNCPDCGCCHCPDGHEGGCGGEHDCERLNCTCNMATS